MYIILLQVMSQLWTCHINKNYERRTANYLLSHIKDCVAHITILLVLAYLLTATHYYGNIETQWPGPNPHLGFDFFSTNQWARFRPRDNSHHKWWTAQYSAGMLTNLADANCQCQDYTNIFHLICDPILENPTYRAKCCFELFTVLGW